MGKSVELRILKNEIFKYIIIFLSIITIIPLIFIIGYIIFKGFSAINLDFFLNASAPPGELGGGILHALIGTGFVVTIGSLIAIPIGIATGLYLSENSNSKFSDTIRMLSDVLQSIPSIIIGVIVYVLIVKPIGYFSALSGGIALAIMMLPMIIRTTEEVLKLIPNSLKEASLALGVPYYRTQLKVILPTAMSGIVSGVLIGVARISGETAPLLFTAFGNQFINLNILKGGVETLPHLIYMYALSPYDSWVNIAWGASFILIVIILIFTLLVKYITSKKSVNL